MNMNTPGYESLRSTLQRAFDQAARTKGAERHANDLPFTEQPMQTIAAKRGVGFLLGQSDKKTLEAQGMIERGDVAKAVHELLGAINYIAGAIIHIEKNAAPAAPAAPAASTPSHSFKEGDRVRIAQEIDESAYNIDADGPGFVSEMEELLGSEGVVRKDYGDEAGIISVEHEDGMTWNWLAKDLTRIEEKPCDCPACTIRRILEVSEETEVKITDSTELDEIFAELSIVSLLAGISKPKK